MAIPPTGPRDQGGGYQPPGSPPAVPEGAGSVGEAFTPTELRRQAKTWLALSIAGVALCGGINCLGVIGAILSYQAGQAVEQGEAADARSKLKWAKIATLVGTSLSFGVLLLLLATLFGPGR